MFGWLWKRIGEAVIGEIEDWLQKPENIEQLTKLADALVDRQMQRLYGKLGGEQKGLVGASEGGLDLGNLVTSRGGISGKKILGLILSRFLGGARGEQRSGGLP